MALITKHRPRTFNTVFGNDAVKESLKGTLKREEDIPHAFLFTGPSGCGKTTFAKIIQRMLKISDIDFKYYNAANTRGIDTIRDIIENAPFKPYDSPKKMLILDEVHQVTSQAQEALLLLLEDPPPHLVLVLCTTEPEKLKVTLKNRCQNHEVKRLSRAEMKNFLDFICKKESVEIPRKILSKIISSADGSCRTALTLLDKIIDISDEEKALEVITSTDVSEGSIKEMCQALLDPKLNAANKWLTCRKILDSYDGDAEQARRAILGYMAKVQLGENSSFEVHDIMTHYLMDTFMYSGKPGLVHATYAACMSKNANYHDDVPF